MVEEICAVPCPADAVRFDLSDLALSRIRAEEGYPGMRARFRAYLGSARITVQLDLGFGDALAVDPVVVNVPPMLDSLPAPNLYAYPPEASVAEKFEAELRITDDALQSRDPAFKALAEDSARKIKEFEAQRTPEPKVHALWDRGQPSPRQGLDWLR